MSQSLYEAIADVEPCLRARPGEVRPGAGEHSAVVCDVAPGGLAATEVALRRCGCVPSVPLLYLSRDEGEAALAGAREIRATAVLSSLASNAQVRFTLRRLIEAGAAGRRAAARPHDLIAAAGVRRASAAFGRILDASRRGLPVSRDELDRGGGAIVSAVGGGRVGPWISTVQAYDDLTHQHSLLVAGLATAFAVHLGMSLPGQRVIAQAALLHDVGKVHVPHAIVGKLEALTPDETEVVRRHASIGFDLLAGQGGFDPRILDVVRHHHELLDGSGYPDGLRGEEISPLVRLTTICDIYAALIERRPYRPPMRFGDALAVIDEMVGKLDRSLVAAFAAFVRGMPAQPASACA